MMLRILRHSLSRQRGRKALAVAAVAAGMAVSTAMLSLRVNLGDDLGAELRRIGANLVITPAADSLPVTLKGIDLRPAGAGALLEQHDLPRIETIFWSNNVKAFTPVLDTPATVEGQAVTVEGVYFARQVSAPAGGRTVTTGVRRLYPAWSVAGRWPRDNARQALAGISFAQRLHLAVGTRITVQGAAVQRELAVTGILTTGTAQDNELVIPLAQVQALVAKPGQFRQVLLAAVTKPDDALARQNPARLSAADFERWMCSPYAATIAAQLQQAWPGSSVHILRPVAESEGAILMQLRLLIWFVTGVALAASGLAISGVMSAAVLERRGEVALMRSLGAQDTAIRSLVLGEAMILGGGGGLLGFALGQGVAAWAAVRILGHAIAWKPALLPFVLLLALAVVLLGSLQPLRLAMRLQPASILRGQA